MAIGDNGFNGDPPENRDEWYILTCSSYCIPTRVVANAETQNLVAECDTIQAQGNCPLCFAFASTIASCLFPISFTWKIKNSEPLIPCWMNISSHLAFFRKVFDDYVAEVESGDNMLDIEPGAAGNEASSRDHVLFHDSSLLFSLSWEL